MAKFTSSCKIIVKGNTAFLTMPDGTIIPEQTGMTIVDKMEERPQVNCRMLIEIEVSTYAEWMQTVEQGKELPRD